MKPSEQPDYEEMSTEKLIDQFEAIVLECPEFPSELAWTIIRRLDLCERDLCASF